MHEHGMEKLETTLHCAGEQLGGEDPRFLSPKSKPQYMPNRSFQPKHIRIDLHVDVKKKFAKGSCTNTIELFENAEKISFDAVSMQVEKVEVNGKKTSFEYDGEKITVPTKHISHKGSVTIHYSIHKPKLGIFFIHPTKERPDKPFQAWTHSESSEARYWYPCQDQPESKCSIEMHLTVENPFIVISNGDLINRKAHAHEKGWTTFSWKMETPNAPYLNAFMIGDFSLVKDKWEKVSVEYYCQPGKEDDIKRAFGKTPQMMRVFSEYLKYPYPHKKYAQIAAADFIYGGMEHTTCTTQTDIVLQDPISHAETPYRPQELASHELAHQWFGDLLTCKDWSQSWLNESFATHFEYVWIESQGGKDEYDYFRYLDMLMYFDEDKNRYRRPIVSNLYDIPGDLFDRTLYQKGALVLALLRDTLGDEAFRNALAHYVNKHAHQAVQTEDLITAIRERTGKNVTKFFDQWVYEAGFPELKVSVHYNSKGKNTVLRVVQTSKIDDKNLWEFPATITITQPNGKEVDHRMNITAREHRFSFPSNGLPLNVVFDSSNLVLKTLVMQKPREMWHYQIKHDSRAIQRILASQELSKTPSIEEINMILDAVEHDAYWSVRLEAALTLRMTGLPFVARKLMKIYSIEKLNRVQRSIVETLSYYRLDDVYTFLRDATKRTDSYIVPAEAYKGIGRWKENHDIAFIQKGFSHKSWMDIVGVSAAMGISSIQTEHALRALISATDAKYSNQIRQAAVRGMGIVGGKREEAMHALLELTKDDYINMQLAATETLGLVGDERVIPELEKLQIGHRDSRVKRAALESIRQINGGCDLPSYKEEKKDK